MLSLMEIAGVSNFIEICSKILSKISDPVDQGTDENALASTNYCRFGNVCENLIFANIREFVVSQIQSPRQY